MTRVVQALTCSIVVYYLLYLSNCDTTVLVFPRTRCESDIESKGIKIMRL